MNILTMLQYLTLSLFALNAAFGLARAFARGAMRAFAHECGESLMTLFLLAEMLRSFDLI
jgi:hypothetical protein